MTEKIDVALAGRELPPVERVVAWRDTTNYAAAVGDANPRYLDDTAGSWRRRCSRSR